MVAESAPLKKGPDILRTLMAQGATKDRDLVGSGVYYKVERGITMKIVPTQRAVGPGTVSRAPGTCAVALPAAGA